MQAWWPLHAGRRQLRLSLDEPRPGPGHDRRHAVVQRELTGDLLDFYDSHAPGELERRGLQTALTNQLDAVGADLLHQLPGGRLAQINACQECAYRPARP